MKRRTLIRQKGRANRKIWLLLPIFMFAVIAAPARNIAQDSPFAKTVSPTATKALVDVDDAIEHAEMLSVAFRSAADKVLPSVVAIETRMEGRIDPRTQESGNAFGIGSGVIVDKSGVILTNNHVVMGGEGHVTVRLDDGREYTAAEIYTDPKSDIAVIRIEGATGLVSAKLGDSDLVSIGDWVIALGQPFGLESSVTAGIISAKNRGIGIADRENFLQTDAAINPGNSGGPLVNLKGEIVGINTAISSRSGGNNGVGFAVPVNLARWVGDQLLTYGAVHRAYLGVGVQPMDFKLAKKLNAPNTRGVVVTHVQRDTPAANAGLAAGDVIVSINGRDTFSPNQLQLVIERTSPGKQQHLKILRYGYERTIKFAASEMPRKRQVAHKPAITGRNGNHNELGLQIASLDSDIARRLRIPRHEKGVVVAGVLRGGIADRAGLKPGMLITQIERKPISSVQDMVDAIGKSDDDEGILFLIKTPVGSRFMVLKAD